MLSAVIVEDEPPARDRLRRLLSRHSDWLVVVSEAENGPDAVRVIDQIGPDVVFLDVSLPGFDGFEVLKSLQAPPAVIFTTAHDEFAVRAFRESAVDYLLKPIQEDQLEAAVSKLATRGVDGASRHWNEVLSALRTIGAQKSRRIACRIGDSTVFVPMDEVHYFRADQGYTLVKTDKRELLIDTPLVELENRLDPTDFVRIHRNTLVNMNHVTSLRRGADGIKVVLKDGNELVVSRRYADNLRT